MTPALPHSAATTSSALALDRAYAASGLTGDVSLTSPDRDPYTVELLAYTKRPTPARFAARATARVPSTFTVKASRGRVPCAFARARRNTISASAITAATQAPST